MEQAVWLETDFFGNSLKDYAWCIGILLLGILLKRLGATFLSKQSFRIFKQFSKNQFSEVFVELLRKPIEQLLLLLILYFAFERLTFPISWNLAPDSQYGLRWFIDSFYGVALFVVIAKILLKATDFFAYVLQNREESPVSIELSNFLKELIKVVLVVLCVFAGLRFVFDVNITALVASLGIGGLAVALAAQDTLANLLGSFVIYLDKPFKAGDLIEADGISGRIEHVGFRTTRIRTLEKSLITVPNKKLIDTALNNITLSDARRVRFNVGLTYNSKPEQITSIIDDIKSVIAAHPKTGEDYVVRFVDFDSSSLNILVIYFVQSNEYEVMVDVKEQINLSIMKIVEKHGCSFAFPTQTIHLQQ
jgi:MscS family membrane protein